MKNISLLIATVGVTVTIVIIASSDEKSKIKNPQPAGASYDKKMQEEQAKKNSILRRFISYNDNRVSL
ncbi:MAG: hypothetical protein JO072_07680 [Parafilimonas sp.]|nr:hypothetical protein [Parafilimonas sp.]